MKQTLGVIGGMGPRATTVFMERIIERTQAQRDQEHLDVIVLNHASIADRTEAIRSGQAEAFLSAIKKDLKLLEAGGAAHIAIPCNTSHFFYEEMQQMTTIPIIHMVRETVKTVREIDGAATRMGVLATEGTIQSGVYHEACHRYGLELTVPDAALQQQVTKIIYDQVKGRGNLDPGPLAGIIRTMLKQYQCDRIILACTELSCLPLPCYQDKVIDAMDVLLQRSITLSGGTYLGEMAVQGQILQNSPMRISG